MIESQKMKEEIYVQRNAYRSIAVRAQIIYFAIKDLGAIDPMY